MPDCRAQRRVLADESAPRMPGDQVHVRVDLPHAGRRLAPRRARRNGSGRGNRPAPVAQRGIRAAGSRAARAPGRNGRPPRPPAVRAPPRGGRPRPAADSAAGNSVFFSPAPARLRWSVPCWMIETPAPRSSNSSGSAPHRDDRERQRHGGPAPTARSSRASAGSGRAASSSRHQNSTTRPPSRQRASSSASARHARAHALPLRGPARDQRRAFARAVEIDPARGRARPRRRPVHRRRQRLGRQARIPPRTSSRPRSAKQRARRACSVSAPPANGTATARAPACTVSSSVL